MKTRICFTFAIAVLLLSLTFLTCKRIEVIPQPTPEKLPIVIGVSTNDFDTKATDYVYEEGDAVGLYVVNYDENGNPCQLQSASGNHLTNQRYVLNSGSWTTDTEVFWKNKTTHADFYCYYPYTNEYIDVENYSFLIKTDQSSENAYKSCDFHWSKTANVAPTSSSISLTNRHLMCRLTINLEAGSGFTSEELSSAKVTILGTGIQATINLTNGAISASVPADINPYKIDGGFRAYIVPQTITNSELIKIEVSGNTFISRQSVTFESGKSQKCTIVVKKTSQGLDVGIGGWENGDDFSGVAE